MVLSVFFENLDVWKGEMTVGREKRVNERVKQCWEGNINGVFVKEGGMIRI